MPFISDQEYAELQAMRQGGAGAAHAERSRFDASALAAPSMLQAAYQQAGPGPGAIGGAVAPGGLAMGPDVAPGMSEFHNLTGQLARQQGMNVQWRPTAGAGGGYWTGLPTDEASLARWGEINRQANAELAGQQYAAAVPAHAAVAQPQPAGGVPQPPAMGGGWSQPRPHQGAPGAPRFNGAQRHMGGGPAAGQGGQGQGGPAAGGVGADPNTQARQQAAQQAASTAWGTF